MSRSYDKKKIKEEPCSSSSFSPAVLYTDLDNPFNDPNFSQPFVWGKKLAAEGKKNLSKKEIEKMHRNQIKKSVEEMEQLKQSRLTRQAARDDIEFLAREEERKKNSDFSEIERKFHLQQAPLRSQIRIKGNRAMPIDHLAVYISFGNDKKPKPFEELEDVELRDPNEYVKGLTEEQYEDLIADVKVYRLLDTEKKQKEFWDDVTTIATSELKKQRELRKNEAVHSAVQQDVIKTFK
ncbi:unnamed protein product [Bursaphelenchus okinawaensis]|uniref:Splicing factor cactin central domain-containing protein n=1 Tax=Bursaphelenchus okinawaensis TaxID=465554 RepID=A0A811K2H0_9BILA|nr:unnamed protein product [Bursaphelenchus okinawaensis]CAG9089837.1 unnamed protein product [Bursaphelenchus okinawaensis]